MNIKEAKPHLSTLINELEAANEGGEYTTSIEALTAVMGVLEKDNRHTLQCACVLICLISAILALVATVAGVTCGIFSRLDYASSLLFVALVLIAVSMAAKQGMGA